VVECGSAPARRRVLLAGGRPSGRGAASGRSETVAIGLYDKESGQRLMAITPAQLTQLQDAMEEEFAEDQDYYITADTLAYLAERGVDPELLEGLRAAIGTRDGFEMLWRNES
jgi:hypothetical protein